MKRRKFLELFGYGVTTSVIGAGVIDGTAKAATKGKRIVPNTLAHTTTTTTCSMTTTATPGGRKFYYAGEGLFTEMEKAKVEYFTDNHSHQDFKHVLKMFRRK